MVFSVHDVIWYKRDEYKERGFIKGDNVVIPLKCPQLGEDNKCKLYKTAKMPKVCRRFPFVMEGKALKSLLPEECGYND